MQGCFIGVHWIENGSNWTFNVRCTATFSVCVFFLNKKIPALEVCFPLYPVARDPKGKIPPPQQQLCTSAQASPATPSTSESAVSHCQPVPEKAPVAPSPPATQASSVAAGGVKAQRTDDCAVKQTEKPPEQHSSSVYTAASTSTSPSPNSVPSYSANTTATTTTTPSSAASTSSYSSPSHSNIAAAVQAKGGPTGKQATKDAMCVVDFERIYRYLSAIHKPTEECHLTSMGESYLRSTAE